MSSSRPRPPQSPESVVRLFTNAAFKWYQDVTKEALVFDRDLFEHAIAFFATSKLIHLLRTATEGNEETVTVPETLLTLLNINPAASQLVLKKVFLVIQTYRSVFETYHPQVERQWMPTVTENVKVLTPVQETKRAAGTAHWERFVRRAFSHLPVASITSICVYSSGLRFMRFTPRRTTQMLHYLVMVMNCMHSKRTPWHANNDVALVLQDFPASVYS
jgi:hypothetical protein